MWEVVVEVVVEAVDVVVVEVVVEAVDVVVEWPRPPSCIATNVPINPNIKYLHERFYLSSANLNFFKRRNWAN